MMDKRTLLHSLMFGGSGGITPSGTLPITANGVIDVTEYANADVQVVSNDLVYMNNSLSTSKNGNFKWISPIIKNALKEGGSFEVVFAVGAVSANSQQLIGIATNSTELAAWSSAHSSLFYVNYSSEGSTFDLNIRQLSVSNMVNGLSVAEDHTIKMDKNFIYVDGVSKVSLPSTIANNSTIIIGSQEGNGRFSGTIKSITFSI